MKRSGLAFNVGGVIHQRHRGSSQTREVVDSRSHGVGSPHNGRFLGKATLVLGAKYNF